MLDDKLAPPPRLHQSSLMRQEYPILDDARKAFRASQLRRLGNVSYFGSRARLPDTSPRRCKPAKGSAAAQRTVGQWHEPPFMFPSPLAIFWCELSFSRPAASAATRAPC